MEILIADDDDVSRLLLKEVLQMLGHQVEEYVEGSSTWERLQQEACPRIVILDWNMPGLDGLELCQRVRKQQRNTPPYLILLTARDRSEDLVKGLEEGADDYLVKPFQMDELRARIAVGERIVALQDGLAVKVRELEEALLQIKTLRGIIPICAHCKKIRDDEGYWNQVDVYVREHTDAQFSHGLCPDCVKIYMADLGDEVSGPSGRA